MSRVLKYNSRKMDNSTNNQRWQKRGKTAADCSCKLNNQVFHHFNHLQQKCSKTILKTFALNSVNISFLNVLTFKTCFNIFVGFVNVQGTFNYLIIFER